MRGIIVVRVLTLVLWWLTTSRYVRCRPQRNTFPDPYQFPAASTYQRLLANEQPINQRSLLIQRQAANQQNRPYQPQPTGFQYGMPNGQQSVSNERLQAQTRRILVNQFQPQMYHDNQQRQVNPIQPQRQTPSSFQQGTTRRRHQTQTIPGRISSSESTMQSTSSTRTQTMSSRPDVMHGDTPFVFPDSHSADTAIVPRIQDEIQCDSGDTYCVNVTNYPVELRIQDLAKYSEFNAVDQINENLVDARFRATLSETEVCAATEHVVYPKAGKTKEDKWMYIVNNQEMFSQGVRVEKCVKEDECRGSAPLGYDTICRQKFILRKMVALDESGKPTTEYFKLPSCCACYTKTSLLGDRISPITSKPRNSGRKRK